MGVKGDATCMAVGVWLEVWLVSGCNLRAGGSRFTDGFDAGGGV